MLLWCLVYWYLLCSAFQEVLNNSDHHPVLLLSNLVEGTYTFHLRVTDAKGESDVERTTVEVKPGECFLCCTTLAYSALAFCFSGYSLYTVIKRHVLDPAQKCKRSNVWGKIIVFLCGSRRLILTICHYLWESQTCILYFWIQTRSILERC